MIAFQCPKCGATLKAPEDKIGVRSKCRRCGCPIRVPSFPGAPVACAVPVTLSDEEVLPILPIDDTPLRFQCPSCESLLERSDSDAGRKIPCPKCGQRLLVPTPMPRASANKTMLGKLIRSPTPSQDEMEIIPLPDQDEKASTPVTKWWRPVSPSFLILALLMFPLPWVEVRCSGGEMGGKTLITQSGLQSIYNGKTLNPTLEAERVRREKYGLTSQSLAEDRNGDFGLFDFGLFDSFAPPMLIYPCVLAVAALFGFILRPSLVRTAVVGIPVFFALFLLLVQIVIGFPLERRVNKSMENAPVSRDAVANNAAMLASLSFDVRYTGWFWIGLLANLASLLALTFEWFAIRSTYGPCLPDWIHSLVALARPDG